MKNVVLATILLLAMTGSAEARQGDRRHAQSCLFEVLYSEELPIAPLFYHIIKATLLVTAPKAPPFEATVVEVIAWQVPPLRRGQRKRAPCDSAPHPSSFF